MRLRLTILLLALSLVAGQAGATPYFAYASASDKTIDSDDLWATAANYPTTGAIVSAATALQAGNTLHANGVTGIAIDADFTADQIDTTTGDGATAGGQFAVSAGPRAVTANVLAGTVACISVTNGSYTLTVNGNVTGSAATANRHGITSNGNAGITVNGTVTAGGAINANAVYVSGGGVITINNGNIINSAYSGALYGSGKIVFNPGAGNYIQYPQTTGDPQRFGLEPAAGDLLSTASVGSVTGTYHAPDAAEVIDTAVFGAGSATAGTFHIPDAAEVINTAVFGVSSATSGTYEPITPVDVIYVLTGHDNYVGGDAGTLTLPTAGTVKKGITYGVVGSLTTGTFVRAGGVR